ncbi:MAG: 1-acyl-sn-glycerol-3-phosphate acyltransferase [Bacteroidota bacterium]
MIVKYLAKFILWIIGWKVVSKAAPVEKKYVVLIAPHTSNLDFFMGKLANWVMGVKPKVLVKKEIFNFFTSPLLRMWGGVPIDRSKGANVIVQVVKMVNENDEFILGITPEGTRKRNPNWKTGFYRIADAAKVPICLAFIDFGKKELSMENMYFPTGDMEKDMLEIKLFYKDKVGYHPEKFAIE